MPTGKQHVALVGSERSPMAGAREVGPANPDERLEVSVRLRSRAGKKAALSAEALAQPLETRNLLTRDQLEKQHGADPASIGKIEAFAREHGLAVVEASAARRTVVLSGTVATMSKAFGVELKQFEHPNGTYRGRTGPVQIPAELQDTIEGVFGLDNRPQAKPHFRRRKDGSGVRAHASGESYTPLQVAAAYNFPGGADGSGECIALIELGGGYKPADLTTYFKQLNLSTTPKVSTVSVDHGKNHPTGDPGGPDGEVMLDIEVAGAVAPGAKIVVYFAPNTDAGFLDAITTAIHDKTNQPTVVSISWGGPESSWTSQAMTSMDEAFQAAAALGVTICVAAGDDGSTDGVTDGLNHVDFPASSPYALACGGTRLTATGSTISSETVWNELANNEGATGGGISDFFALPTFQAGAKVPPSANPGNHVGRGAPDVAGDADPATGYVTRVDGQPDVIGGTSAVAPLWAGLIARINQKLQTPVGYANPLLYGTAAKAGAFHDITSGNNGAYNAGPGWDACSGLGTPIGTALLAALAPAAPARKTGT
ncbi:MAG: protease pro-enzyme activation domain-containing protein [Terriglobales bacterium]